MMPISVVKVPISAILDSAAPHKLPRRSESPVFMSFLPRRVWRVRDCTRPNRRAAASRRAGSPRTASCWAYRIRSHSLPPDPRARCIGAAASNARIGNARVSSVCEPLRDTLGSRELEDLPDVPSHPPNWICYQPIHSSRRPYFDTALRVFNAASSMSRNAGSSLFNC